MRGKVEDDIAARGVYGITPACAGKSHKGECARKWARDHPRVRGEKAFWRCFFLTGKGSPPRARGKVDIIITHAFFPGITPACAGKSH